MRYNEKMMVTIGFLGFGTVIIAYGMAAFSKKMINNGHPNLAKLPFKLLDEATQRSSSPDYGKALASIAAGFAETGIDYIYQETRQSHNYYYQRGGYAWM
ncbi:MAG: hypothetical protein FWE83_09490 [Oscillospiraceae bacterium]|nr:hypothetical protein [Oscillospiraceae bacterium]